MRIPPVLADALRLLDTSKALTRDPAVLLVFDGLHALLVGVGAASEVLRDVPFPFEELAAFVPQGFQRVFGHLPSEERLRLIDLLERPTQEFLRTLARIQQEADGLAPERAAPSGPFVQALRDRANFPPGVVPLRVENGVQVLDVSPYGFTTEAGDQEHTLRFVIRLPGVKPETVRVRSREGADTTFPSPLGPSPSSSTRHYFLDADGVGGEVRGPLRYEVSLGSFRHPRFRVDPYKVTFATAPTDDAVVATAFYPVTSFLFAEEPVNAPKDAPVDAPKDA